jgi:nucleoside-diphosphate-sugar epimerase
MDRILVTGGGGYIGTVLVPLLIAQGYRVRVLDRFFFGRDLLPDHPALEAIQDDVRRVSRAHLDGVSAVIDLAAVSNDPAGESFQRATWQINHQARGRLARLARDVGVDRYLLASTCSVYGVQPPGVVCTEEQPPNPLTTYARASRCAEDAVLRLAGPAFTVVVLRQATAFGLSPRMRFDLAINGMTYGAWKTRRIPVLRDGFQVRPMVHVADTARAHLFMLTADRHAVNGEVFNVGANSNNYRIGELARAIADRLPGSIDLEWYGEPDQRSYRASFDKIANLGFRPRVSADQGALEIFQALEAGRIRRTGRTITLDWYRQLTERDDLAQGVRMYGGILDIDPADHDARESGCRTE